MMSRLHKLKRRAAALAPEPEVEVRPEHSKLEARKRLVSGEKGEYLKYHEIIRICGLPYTTAMTSEEFEYYCEINILGKAFDSGFRFFKEQAEALATFEEVGGLLAPIGVGFGKTLTSLVIAQKAFAGGMERIMLLVPPQVFYQLTQVDIKWARTKVPFSVPVHLVGGSVSKRKRMQIASSGRKGLYISTYSCLSTQDAADLMEGVQPQLIICDEAHALANKTSARTKRLFNYIDHYRPQGVALSGTITSKSIMDYHHISRWCLDQNSPLPVSVTMAQEWASLLDADTQAGMSAYGPLVRLLKWARSHVEDEGSLPANISGYRRAFQVRLVTSPGVVATGDADIGVSLTIQEFEEKSKPTTHPDWHKLQDFMDGVQQRWETPNGDEIDHAMHTYKWMYELSCGFYNQLTWPTPSQYAERIHVSVDKATELLDRAKEAHQLKQLYNSALRAFLQDVHITGLDTPMLVGGSMANHGDRDVPRALYDAWTAWKDAQTEGLPERDREAIRVCDYKITEAVRWAKHYKNGIIWIHNQEIGVWVYEYLVKAGVDCIHCPAGQQFNRTILDHSNSNKIIVASMAAHGTGKNLQHFTNQLFLQWPRQARLAEQVIGRTHRNGQKADELIVHVMHRIQFDELNFASCLNDSLYIHQTTATRQKLIYASYDPMPKIYPSELLAERGMQVKLLSQEQKQLLSDKFGQDI